MPFQDFTNLTATPIQMVAGPKFYTCTCTSFSMLENDNFAIQSDTSTRAGSGVVTQVFRCRPFFHLSLSLQRLFVSTCFENFLQYSVSTWDCCTHVWEMTECPITCLIQGAFKSLCLGGVVASCGCILLPILASYTSLLACTHLLPVVCSV